MPRRERARVKGIFSCAAAVKKTMVRILASLFEFVLVVFVARFLGFVIEGLWGGKHAQSDSRRANSSATTAHRTVDGRMARDPICGIFVSTELSHRLNSPTGTLHFCSPGCRERYEKGTVAQA